jgi:hypothetical protein
VTFRRTCIGCGGTKRRAYWASSKREQVLARCLDCGVNFNGEGVFLPSLWATSSVMGLEMQVDPKAVPA